MVEKVFFAKKKFLLIRCCSVFIVILLFNLSFIAANQTSNHAKQTAYKPIVAAQLIDLSFKNNIEADELFQHLENQGVNTVFIRIFQNIPKKRLKKRLKYKWEKITGVYFKSKVAPVIKDYLSLACNAAAKHNIKLFAWMTTRHCDWFIKQHRDWRDLRFNLNTGQLEFYNSLDIFNKNYQTAITELFKELSNYPIEGILLQDDCILHHTEGFSPAAINAYFIETDYKIQPEKFYPKLLKTSSGMIVSNYSRDFYAWRNWKIQKLLSFQKMLIDASHSVNPHLKFAVNFYYETLSDIQNGKTWFAQDLEKAKAYPIDFFAIMAYQKQIANEKKLSLKQVNNLLKKMTENALLIISNPNKIIMKFQTLDWKTKKTVPISELNEIISIVKNNSPSIGIAFVPYSKSLPIYSFPQLNELNSTGFSNTGYLPK